ncbi:hypothetical protein W59_12866 [Rhodococcus opacus RKJ300 = JCM 13270]|uniref:Uncharacterized protein n=1 Tax=Rhodococcus opacus RKJ300 = JCM 13270 TaxID=1165867 RepID=I0WT43_RHOOP|nr:hypothetical protein W59_12866 [Rhodococcus opacus RKJ300 = JCM 13270]
MRYWRSRCSSTATPSGGLNLLYTTVREFTDYDRRLAAVLAASAVMHLIRDDAAHRRAKLTERTLGLIHDRVHVDRAVGLTAAPCTSPRPRPGRCSNTTPAPTTPRYAPSPSTSPPARWHRRT